MVSQSKFVAAIKRANKNTSVRLLQSDADIGRVSRWLHTGSFALDLALGQGWPFGRIIEIFGNESSGKTALCHHALAEVQRQGGIAVLFEQEGAYLIDFAAVIGVDSSQLLFYQPRTVEDVFDEIDDLLEVYESDGAKRPMAICWDSVAGTPVKAVADGGADANVYGKKAGVLSQGLSRLGLPLEKANVLFICVNQIRDNVGAKFGAATWKTPGGHGLPFHASIRLKLTKRKDIMGDPPLDGSSQTSKKTGLQKAADRQTRPKGEPIGNLIGGYVHKSKVASPHRRVELDFYYDTGLDPYAGLVDLLYRRKRIQRSGGYYVYRGEKFRAAAIADMVEKCPNLLLPLMSLKDEEAANKEVVK